VGDLADCVKTIQGIEGVTFVGGEPFAQARALASLASRLSDSGLSVMAYSGFTLDQLLDGVVPDALALLNASDLLMDGPYVQNLTTQKPWRGSDNQQLIALSERYGAEVRGWNQPTGQSFEMCVAPDGTLEVLGIPPLDLVASLPTHVSAATETRPLASQVSDTSPGKIARRTDGEETEDNLFKKGAIP
jgi:anaerobic ribonucleoside-triphosphate reductase activating protein